MALKPFLAPRAKIDRSRSQIDDLDRAIQSFIEAAECEIVAEADPETDQEVWRFRLKDKVPAELSVRTGEIIHNLRSALDQIISEIASTTGLSESGIEFPFGKDYSAFEAALNKQKKIPEKAAELIRSFRPYKGGDELLWFLHNTNRKDKHRSGLVPVNLRTGGKTSYLSLWFGQALIIGSKSGQHLICERNLSDADYIRLALTGKAWRVYGSSKMDLVTGLPLGPPISRMSFENFGGSAESTWEFLTTTPGTKFKTDFEPAFDLAFKDSGALEREPVVRVLSNASDLVQTMLQRFQSDFFP